MTDFFALLDEERRPWLDPETLKQKFVTLSATVHPDKIHSGTETAKAEAAKKFATINTAHQSLSDSKSRLLHLLELELGARPKDIQVIPAELADLFAEIAAVCQRADTVLAGKKENTSPLLAVQWFERAQGELDRLDSAQNKLRPLREQLDRRLKELDKAWTAAGGTDRRGLLPSLEELYRLFSYFNRWDRQIQERRIQLTA